MSTDRFRPSPLSSLAPPRSQLELGLPKGRMSEGVLALLRDAGVSVGTNARDYRPSLGLEGFRAKVLKPQNILEMLGSGRRDLGFAGADWVEELGVDVVEVLDTELDPVQLVVAAPESLFENGELPQRPLVMATEYRALGERWAASSGRDISILRSFGATEVFPPEDADLILDNTATGATLTANRLQIIEEVTRSTTRLYASRGAWNDPKRRLRIESLAELLTGVLEARRRVILELNVDAKLLADVSAVLPSMRGPTISPLAESRGFSLKVAVPRAGLPELLTRIRGAGGRDILVTTPNQILGSREQ